jgi:hypothetical protein
MSLVFTFLPFLLLFLHYTQHKQTNKNLKKTLKSVEVYDIENDKWEFLGGADDGNGDLLSARGDQAMVATQSNGRIYAIGGEVSHPNQCASPELVPPLSAQSIAVDDVEVYDTTTATGGNEWIDIVDIPEFRFRFTAAAWSASSSENGENGDDYGSEQVFAFGGQTSFDESCKCFPTSNEITTIIKTTTNSGSGSSSSGSSITATSTGSIAATGNGSTSSATDSSGSGILLAGDTYEENDEEESMNTINIGSSTTNASLTTMMWMFSTIAVVVVVMM